MGTVLSVRVWDSALPRVTPLPPSSMPPSVEPEPGVDASPRRRAARIIDDVFGVVSRWEDRLSTWRQATPLSRLRRSAAGTPVPLTRPVVDALFEVRRWSAATSGAFDPTVGALIDAWDLRGSGRVPSNEQLARARGLSGWANFRLDGTRRSVTRTTDSAWIDSGAFGKGLALRAALDTLRALGVDRAILDFGGQVVLLGAPPNAERSWRVSVARPDARLARALGLCLRGDQSVATSAASGRVVTVGGGGPRLGHVVDPRTGRPVHAWGSVTVVTSDPLSADVLATALFVMGADQALAWAEAHPGVGVLVIEAPPVEAASISAPHDIPMLRWSASLASSIVIDSTAAMVR